MSLGEQIANENQMFKVQRIISRLVCALLNSLLSSAPQEELLLACSELKVTGESMHRATVDFSEDTLDIGRKEAMAEASRVLLMVVTRLLVIVDSVDTDSPSRASQMVN